MGACIGRVGAAATLAVGLASAAVAAPPLAGAPLPPPPPAAPSGAALLSGDGPLVISAPAQTPPPGPLPAGLSPTALGAAEPPGPRALPSAPPVPAATGLLPAPAALIPAGRELVLDRRRRRLEVRDNGITVRRFPVAVGMPGWETPVGRFAVLEKTPDPVWEHPQSGVHTPPGAANPLGSRWIGFHRDCSGRRGWDGESMLDLKGCVVAGFHGTPHRWTVGHAVSHGCVRLYDEDVRILFEMVRLGMPVTVLP